MVAPQTYILGGKHSIHWKSETSTASIEPNSSSSPAPAYQCFVSCAPRFTVLKFLISSQRRTRIDREKKSYITLLALAAAIRLFDPTRCQSSPRRSAISSLISGQVNYQISLPLKKSECGCCGTKPDAIVYLEI
jgi:hypothetical protein